MRVQYLPIFGLSTYAQKHAQNVISLISIRTSLPSIMNSTRIGFNFLRLFVCSMHTVYTEGMIGKQTLRRLSGRDRERERERGNRWEESLNIIEWFYFTEIRPIKLTQYLSPSHPTSFREILQSLFSQQQEEEEVYLRSLSLSLSLSRIPKKGKREWRQKEFNKRCQKGRSVANGKSSTEWNSRFKGHTHQWPILYYDSRVIIWPNL